MDVLDVSTHPRAKGDVISSSVDICSVICKLRVYGLCSWTCNYLIVVMKLVELLRCSVHSDRVGTCPSFYTFLILRKQIFISLRLTSEVFDC